MRTILHLATMEVKSECTREIAKFRHLFNRMLSVASGKEGYKFNPKAFLVDDKMGTNFANIKQEFGEGLSLM